MWSLLFMAFLPLKTNATFNFYMSQEEMLKLLGIQYEVFYVKEGIVDSYPASFVVNIPANVTDLHFCWQSLSEPLPYILKLSYDGEGALLPPQMNISTTGVIPTSVQMFRIKLRCTGLRSAQIEVQIELNVTNIYLNIKRNKICLEGESTFRNDSIFEQESNSKLLYITVTCSLSLITVALVLVSTSRTWRKNKKIHSQAPLYMTAVYDGDQQVYVRVGPSTIRTPSVDSGSYATIGSYHKLTPSPTPYATNAFTKISQETSAVYSSIQKLQTLWVSKSSVTLEEMAEEGTFGQIYRGKFNNQNTVTIKTVTEAASQHEVTSFISEGLSMYRMLHKNVLPILAVNIDNPKQPLLIYPYVNKGNLKRFLLKCKEEEKRVLSTLDIVDISIQILLGIMYLNSQCFVHEDLAARNCVLDDSLQVKITDSSLARDFFPEDYYYLNGDTKSKPLKWLAIESIGNEQYDTASLVWSFGVLLWELTTLAQEPYPGIQPSEVYAYLRKGFRLRQAQNCPDELFTVMASCWVSGPSERPTCVQLLAYLQEFYTYLGRYV